MAVESNLLPKFKPQASENTRTREVGNHALKKQMLCCAIGTNEHGPASPNANVTEAKEINTLPPVQTPQFAQQDSDAYMLELHNSDS